MMGRHRQNGHNELDLRRWVMLALIALLGLSPWTGSDAQTLYWLGGLSINGRSVALDVSTSGVVVGWAEKNGTPRAFVWSFAEGMRELVNTFGGTRGVANAVLDHGPDNYIIAGGADTSSGSNHAFRGQRNWTSIRRELNEQSVAFDIAPKGGERHVFVGWAHDAGGSPSAIYWGSYEQGGVGYKVYLERDPNVSSYAFAIAPLNFRIVGRFTTSTGDWHAFYWDFYGSQQLVDIGTLGGCCSAAEDVSADGRIIVGWAYDANNRVRAFLWWGGNMRDLGTLGGQESMAHSVDHSGTVVVGAAQDRNSEMRAVMWMNGSIQDLNRLVADQLSPGSRLIEATSISPTARYIVGYGYRAEARRIEAFLLDLQVSEIPGDVDGDRCVDDRDLLAVLFAFGGWSEPEDLNNDGVVDDADLLEVLFNFGQGGNC